MRRPPSLAALPIACALAVAGCGGDEEGGAASRARAVEPSEPSTTAAGGTERPGRLPAPARDAPDPPAGAPAEGGPDRRPGRPARSAPDAAARATLAAFFAAMGARDEGRACRTFSRQLRSLVGSALGTGCRGGMTAAFALFVPAGLKGAFADIEVRRLEVDGDRATAALRLPSELRRISALQFVAREDSLSLQREGGEWKVAPPAL